VQAVLHAVHGELEHLADLRLVLELGLRDHALRARTELDDHVVAAEAGHRAFHESLAGARRARAHAALLVELLQVHALEGGFDFLGERIGTVGISVGTRRHAGAGERRGASILGAARRHATPAADHSRSSWRHAT
jgi:hypothetical protein